MSLDKALKFIELALDSYNSSSPPLVFGISGPQGSGKTYLAEHLKLQISEKYPNLKCIKFSMDDVYLTNADQKALTNRSIDVNNKLLQGRGLPGTHDVEICVDVMQKLRSGRATAIPVYDKSSFAGEGDRVSFIPVTEKPDVVIFEGWFNGYSPLDEDQVRLKYLTSDMKTSTLPIHKLFHVEDINKNLQNYVKIWSLFDYFIFIDTDFTNVYKWRLEQEHNMIKETSSGMTDLQVKEFIDRYIPVYELYYQNLCDRGGCIQKKGANLRLVLSESRALVGSEVI